MAEQVADLGFDSDVPRRTDEKQAGLSGLGSEDYFLWSRIDGHTSISELFTMSGQSRGATIETLRRLSDRGLIDLPNRASPPPAPQHGLPIDPPTLGKAWDRFEPSDDRLRGPSDLPPEVRKLVLYYQTYMTRVTYYQLFGLEPASLDQPRLTRDYYRLSKLLHPDRWFRKSLGPFDMPLRDVFAWLSKAYRTLSDTKRRHEYDGLLKMGLLGPWDQAEKERQQSGTKAGVSGSHGLGRNALLARGRRYRADGNYSRAADCFRRALRLAPDSNLALELAEVLHKGGTQLDEALQTVRDVNAEKAQNYAALVLEARILRGLGRIEEARQVCRSILEAKPNHLAAQAELDALEEA